MEIILACFMAMADSTFRLNLHSARHVLFSCKILAVSSQWLTYEAEENMVRIGIELVHMHKNKMSLMTFKLQRDF